MNLCRNMLPHSFILMSATLSKSFFNKIMGLTMNKVQIIVLWCGLLVVATIFISPYGVEKYSYNCNAHGEFDKRDLIKENIEFYFAFLPPQNVEYTKELFYDSDVEYYREVDRYIKRQKDFSLHFSILVAELLTISLLLFIFKNEEKISIINPIKNDDDKIGHSK